MRFYYFLLHEYIFFCNFTSKNMTSSDIDINKALRKIEQQEAEINQLKRELHLMTLRRKVTPHFLFNSLSVATSLVLQSPKTAIQFLRLLANSYRYLLKHGDELHVPVERELVFMEQYYELMSLRHVNSIRLTISADAKRLRNHPLPPLALQGLLENAIKHNVHTEDSPLDIDMYTECDDNGEKWLCISNKRRPLISDEGSSQFGLRYINETLSLLFNRQLVTEDNGETFTAKLPMI